MPMMHAISGSNGMKHLLLTGLSFLALAGCTVGPDYHKPQVSAPATWRATQPPAQSRISTASTDPAWWTLFHDPVLSRLEREVAASNLDLQAASLRLMQSRAERRIASAAQLPHMEANASYARERASSNGILGLMGNMEQAGAGSIASGAQGFGPAALPGSVGNPSFNLSTIRNECFMGGGSMGACAQAGRGGNCCCTCHGRIPA